MAAFRTTILLAYVLLALPTVLAQSSPQNLDFEEGQIGQLPPDWLVPTPGYTGAVVEGRVRQGQRCARLSSDQSDDQAPFGNLMQTIAATPYRGKRLRLKAAVRVAIGGFDDKAQLWLRVDRAGGQKGFFDNMGDRPIRLPRWKYHEIIGDVASDAQTINFGLMLNRNGQAWLDDVSLEIIDVSPEEAVQGPRPLEGRGLENLVAFTRLLGYVRFFHPSDEATETNWDDFAILGVRRIEDAEDPADLAGRLEQLFRPIAPTVQVFPTGRQPPMPEELSPKTDAEILGVITWRHHGVQFDSPTAIYRSNRVREVALDGEVPKRMPNPAEPLITDIGAGVACLVPQALWINQVGTIPWARGTATAAAPQPTIASGNDRTTRLAAVALAWNVFQHFYPYFDVVQTDWPAVLRESLTAAALDADERAFLDTLRRMVTELHDGHGRVTHGSDTAYATLPLLWDWVEDHLVVTCVDEKATQNMLEPGDVVRSIDGRSAAMALIEQEQFISGATTQWKRYRALQELAHGDVDTTVTLELEDRDGKTRSVTVKRTIPPEQLHENRPEKIAEVQPGIMYVDLDRITDDDFKQALPRLKQASGIVFDLRGYPNKISTIAIAHLIDEPITCAQWHVPVVTKPDRVQMEYSFSNWSVTALKPRLKAKVAFITDGSAISYAETYLGIIEHYGLAEIVGEPTAGTNGNVNLFKLPGSYQIAWTGMRVLKHDGSQHHGVGIRPTVPVSRTIHGIRAGRDELLDKALKIVR